MEFVAAVYFCNMKYTRDWLIDNWVMSSKSLRQLAREEGLSSRAFEQFAVRYKLKKVLKYRINEDKISLDDPVFQYFLGLFAADGYADKSSLRVTIDLKGEAGKELLYKLQEYFESTAPLRRYKLPKGSEGRWRLTLTSKKLRLLIESLGMGVNKTSTLQLPSLPTYNHFLRGFVDGDGSIEILKKPRVRWYCHSKQFNLQVQKLFPFAKVTQHRRCIGTNFGIYRKDSVVNFLEYIYEDTYFAYQPKLLRAQQLLK